MKSVSGKPPVAAWSLLRPSFELLRQNFEQVAYLSFLPSFITSLGLALLNRFLDRTLVQGQPFVIAGIQEQLGFIVVLIGIVWSLVSFPAFVYLALKVSDNESPGIGECYRKGLHYFWRIVALNLLVGILTIAGFMLFIIPGIIMVRRYFLANYYLIGKDLNVKQALLASAKNSKQFAPAIWGVIGVAAFFGVVVALFVGMIPVLGPLLSILASYPYIFAPVLRYRELTNNMRIIQD